MPYLIRNSYFCIMEKTYKCFRDSRSFNFFYKISIIALIFGVIGFVLTFLYNNHSWNQYEFKVFHDCDVSMIAYLYASVVLILCFISFKFLFKKKNSIFMNILFYIIFFVQCVASIAIFINTVVCSLDVNKTIKFYQFDNYLESSNKKYFNEAVDSLYKILVRNYGWQTTSEINKYILQSARNGYPNAQYYVAYMMHKRVLYLSRNENTLSSEANELLKRATYWIMKAAENNESLAQVGLGRMYSDQILTLLPYNRELAEYWLLEGANNGEDEAYYWLGKMYENINIKTAQYYWQKGAKKNNERCQKKLENPMFIN